MPRTTIAILGMGPRGLSILERLITLYHHYPQSGKIDILLVDPNEMGTGAHSPQQPDHLLVNTVACQITLFGDTTVKDAGPTRSGPCFYQWATEQGYRHIDGHIVRATEGGRAIQPNDYLPRRLLGEYLSWAYRELIRELPPGLNVRQLPLRAVNLYLRDDGKTDILLEEGVQFSADFIYITTGHGKNMPSLDDHRLQQFVSANQSNNPRLQYYATPYPMSALDAISPDTRVLVQGIGLTAYDVLSQLTYGRGGVFTEKEGRLSYTPSGREPKIALFSRQALPFSSRGTNQKGVGGQYTPSFLTIEAIRQLRAQNSIASGSPQLDFEKQILPLLLKEMSYVYRCTLQGNRLEPASYQVNAEESQAIQTLLYPHQDKTFSSLCEYSRFFAAHLEDDLAAAEAGNVEGAVKAATDVIRDVRDILRAAIDFGGLTAASHRRFLEHFCPLFNRIAVGPPKQRNQELQALMNAGIVTLAGGPSTTLVLNARSGCFETHSTFTGEVRLVESDVLIKAKIDSFSPLYDDSSFIRNLTAQGIFRPYINQGFHPGGIDIDRHQHPINSKGRGLTTLWALGNLAEGPNFYTYVLPRPLVNSRAIRDAGQCVINMYQQLLSRRSVNGLPVYEC
ncbi:FAD/NAD(P)-binding protein [Brenneria goodwinii]|uniref:FAD/NAD(P)-binding protein n=1 Tax=Brenneria goodwinii TaxID=1109412 RepID=UPI0036E4A79A